MIQIASAAVNCVLLGGLAGPLFGEVTWRASIDSAGVQGNAQSITPSISIDGRYVAFQSAASNLVAGDTNGFQDIFVHDREAGATARASVTSLGVQGNASCSQPAISADGRYVVFDSSASNLVPGDTNGGRDVFLHDFQSGSTERVSVGSTGGQANGGSSIVASISADGTQVAFYSSANNLVSGDTNGNYDVFVRNRQSGITERVSVTSSGGQANSWSGYPSISSNGGFVVFESSATNLVPGDTTFFKDIFVHDLHSGATERVSVDSAGVQANGNSGYPSISSDGRFVTFQSFATNLVPGDTNGSADIFVHDRQTATTSRVSVDSAGAQTVNGSSNFPEISSDGNYVVFESTADGLVFGDTNGVTDVFVHDRHSGSTERISVTSVGAQANSNSYNPSISGDGGAVAFYGWASNLVSGDTNGVLDVFVRDRGSPYSGTPFCFGDGMGTLCPCANTGPAGGGCLNSLGTGGALHASGSASVILDTFVLIGGGMPNGTALYFQGTLPQSGGLGTVFGDGLRCAAGTIIRLGTKTNVAGASQYPAAGDQSVSVRGLVASPGIRTYQVWYRNAAAFCTPSTFNLTSGWQVSWTM